jgi:hypothetical protein
VYLNDKSDFFLQFGEGIDKEHDQRSAPVCKISPSQSQALIERLEGFKRRRSLLTESLILHSI